MKSLIAIIVYSLWFTVNAQAASTIVKVGVDPFAGSFSDVKYVSLGREIGLTDHSCLKADLGYYWDKRPKSLNAVHADVAIGLVIKPWIFDVRIYSGIAGISHVDKYLGSHWQLFQEVAFSFQEGGAGIGLALTHYSNAGLAPGPNLGRNFATLHVVIPY